MDNSFSKGIRHFPHHNPFHILCIIIHYLLNNSLYTKLIQVFPSQDNDGPWRNYPDEFYKTYPNILLPLSHIFHTNPQANFNCLNLWYPLLIVLFPSWTHSIWSASLAYCRDLIPDQFHTTICEQNSRNSHQPHLLEWFVRPPRPIHWVFVSFRLDPS